MGKEIRHSPKGDQIHNPVWRYPSQFSMDLLSRYLGMNTGSSDANSFKVQENTCLEKAWILELALPEDAFC